MKILISSHFGKLYILGCVAEELQDCAFVLCTLMQLMRHGNFQGSLSFKAEEFMEVWKTWHYKKILFQT